MEGYDRHSGAADLGTAVHLVAARMIQDEDWGMEEVALAYQVDADELEFLANRAAFMWRYAENPVSNWFPEPQVEQQLNIENFVEDELHLSGTADVWRFDEDTMTAYVWDWKSGYRTMADYRAQLATYALLIAARTGAERVWVGIGWLRDTDVEGQWIEPDDLGEWRSRLAEIPARALNEKPTAGDQCVYCPAAPGCAAVKHWLRALEDVDEDSLTEDTAYEFHVRRQVQERLCRAAGETMKAYLSTKANGVPAAPGKRLKLHEQQRDKVIVPKALDWMMDEYRTQVVCDRCDGRGVFAVDQVGTGETCPACNGDGHTYREDWLGALSASKTAIIDLAKAKARAEGGKVGKAATDAANALKELGALEPEHYLQAQIVLDTEPSEEV